MSITEQTLNELDALIYVTDLETDEIIFVNDKMKEEFGEQGNSIGKKCWTVLQSGMSERCAFCAKHQLEHDPTTPVVWEELNTATNKYYKNTDSVIDWVDGRKVHMQYSRDINDVKQVEIMLNKRLGQQELMSSISQSFAGMGDMEALTKDALEKVGEFLDVVDIAYIAKDLPDEKKFVCVSKWNRDENTYVEDMDVHYKGKEKAYEDFKACEINIFNDVTAIPEEDYIGLKRDNIKARIIVPLFVKNAFWGYLGVVSYQTNVWDENDCQLVMLVSNAFSVVQERMEAEKKLFDAEQKLRVILDNAPIAIFWKDTNSIFQGCNRAFADRFDPLGRGVAGKIDYDFMEKESAEITLAEDKKIFETGQMMEVETHTSYIDRGERWRHTIKSPIKNENGEIVSIVGIFEDITERKRLSDALIKEKEAAEYANKAKTDFLSRMSHEIRTPMNAIIGMTKIARDTQDAAKNQYCLEKIDKASRHLLGVINDILDMSKIEAERLELAEQAFDFEKMVMDSINIVAFQSEEKNHNLLVNLDKELPRFIVADETRVKQVITNLLSNAVKFTDENGTIRLNVKVLNHAKVGVKLLLEVIDNGIGIEKNQLDKLFNAFEQGEGGITRRYGGTGLGLAICKKIVELMGGEIWIESEIGKGSKFSFTFETETVEQDENAKYLKRTAISDVHILAIDDSPDIRQYFTYVMDEFGIECDVADGGASAIEMVSAKKAQGNRYDIIFLDWKMPGMNGIATARKINEIVDDNTIIIMISIFEWDKIRKEALSAGINRFISKPLFPSVLLDAISSVYDGQITDDMSAPGKKKYYFEGYRILLAEDVEVNSEIVLAMLEDTGVQIECAKNGEVALGMFEQGMRRYDLILMDIHMPVMDGYEATEKIRVLDNEWAKEIPIIAMTADAFSEDIEKCKKVGMNEHIAKPVDSDELLSALNIFLYGKKREEQRANMINEDIQTIDISAYINVEEGIKRVLGNKKLFFKLLGGCKVQGRSEDLVSAIESGDTEEAEYIAHEIKGVAANLSMTALFRVATDLDARLKAGIKDDELVKEFKETADQTAGAIVKLLKTTGA